MGFFFIQLVDPYSDLSVRWLAAFNGDPASLARDNILMAKIVQNNTKLLTITKLITYYSLKKANKKNGIFFIPLVDPYSDC